tara:strand:+ start:1669 stop:1932 length:264 start_codon:yes stop_codon:yes gene_type:complete
MTPAEIFEMAGGYQERLDTQMHLLAWHAANVMNVHLKKKVTVKKLLGKQKSMSPLEREAEGKKLMRVLEERRKSSDGSWKRDSDTAG